MTRAAHIAMGWLTVGLLLLLTGCDPPGKPKPSDQEERPEEVSDFGQLYKQNCAGCHGADGQLGPAPPLKDPLFLASSVFVKKPERIVALSLVMVLCLLVYRLAEHRLREQLAETGLTVPNQVSKPINRPTLRWIFQCFEGISLLTFPQPEGPPQQDTVGLEPTFRTFRLAFLAIHAAAEPAPLVNFAVPHRLAGARQHSSRLVLDFRAHGLNSRTASMTRVCSASVSAQKNGRRRRRSLISSVTGRSPGLPPYRSPNLERCKGK